MDKLPTSTGERRISAINSMTPIHPFLPLTPQMISGGSYKSQPEYRVLNISGTWSHQPHAI